MHLAIFDLDNTLLAGDSDYLWGQYLVNQGVVEREHYLAENQRFYEQYQAGTLDIHAFQRFSLQPLIDNPQEKMLALRTGFIRDVITPIIAPGARKLIAEHRDNNHGLLIITATNSFVTTPISTLLGIESILATEPEVRNGRYTGAIHGTPCFQAGKLTRLDAWLAKQPQVFEKLYGYSDSINDLPLLERVDLPVAIDPDARLEAAAKARGWPVRSLRN